MNEINNKYKSCPFMGCLVKRHTNVYKDIQKLIFHLCGKDTLVKEVKCSYQ